MKYLKLFESTLPTYLNIMQIDNSNLRHNISRYALALEEYVLGAKGSTPVDGLLGKLDILSKTGDYEGMGAQCLITIYLLLQNLKKIKDNFHRVSAGFLFEDYIAGLLHIDIRKGERENADIKDSNRKTYQIKFYKDKKRNGEGKWVPTPIYVNKKLCHYSIIGIKKQNEVHIWIIKKEETQFFGTVNPEGKKISILRGKLKKEKEPYILKFNNIDNNLRELGKKLNKTLEKLHFELRELNHNIEAIMTGVDKNKKLIEINIDDYFDNANINIDNIKKQLKKATTKIRKNLDRLEDD